MGKMTSRNSGISKSMIHFSMKYLCANAVDFASFMAELTYQLYDKYYENQHFTERVFFGQSDHCLLENALRIGT